MVNAAERALRGPDDVQYACSGTKSVDFGRADEKVGTGDAERAFLLVWYDWFCRRHRTDVARTDGKW